MNSQLKKFRKGNFLVFKFHFQKIAYFFHMKLKLTSFVLGLCFSLTISAQEYSLVSGARSEGLAHSSVTLLDLFAAFHNPSVLAWNTENQIGLSGRHNFSIPGYATAYGAGAFATSGGNMGFSFSYNGDDSYHDMKTGIYYAHHFGEIFAPSISINLYNHFIRNYDVTFVLTADFGLTANLDKLRLGFYWGNLNNGKWPTETSIYNTLPMYFRLGGSYHFTEDFFISAEAIQEVDYGLGGRFGIEYIIEDIIAVRGGYSSNPQITSFGVSLILEKISIDGAVSFSQQLGYSPHLGLVYTW